MNPQQRRRAQLVEAFRVNELADPYANLSIQMGSRATDYALTVELHGSSTVDAHALAGLVGWTRQDDLGTDRDGAGRYLQRSWTGADPDTPRRLLTSEQTSPLRGLR